MKHCLFSTRVCLCASEYRAVLSVMLIVSAMARSEKSNQIVKSLVNLSHDLNMDVVAEGVEDEAQLNFLQKLGCTYAQGLLFGDPMSSENFLELLLAQVEGTDTHRALFA